MCVFICNTSYNLEVIGGIGVCVCVFRFIYVCISIRSICMIENLSYIY